MREKLEPLDITQVLKKDNLDSNDKINQWIREGIKCFREWYQPVDFGDGIIADVTSPPKWETDPKLNRERGIGKWNYIIKGNLPDLKNKRILDLGCNNGIISIQLAKSGAKEVIGIDRNEFIHQKTYKELPAQNIIAQANFVKDAFELKEKAKYNIQYIAWDIAKLGSLNLGKFDIILALCVLYHEKEKMPALIKTIAKMTDCLVLQTNLTHDGELRKWANLQNHVKYLYEVGFTKINIEAPIGYHMPMIIGMK